MNSNKKTRIVNAGDTRVLVASICKEFNTLAQCVVFYVEGEHDTDVDIIDVERINSVSKELCVGERLELKATFSIPENRVSYKTDENVKWKVKIDGEEERLIMNGLVITGSEIEFFIPEDWAEKEVVLMPSLMSALCIAIVYSVSYLLQ